MYSKDEAELLHKLQPGDQVIHISDGGFYGNAWILVRVKRITNNQIILDMSGESRFWKKDGYRVGSNNNWHRDHIHPYVGEYIDQYNQVQIEQDENRRRNNARSIINNAHLANMPLEKLERIADIIKEKEHDD